MHPKSNSMEQKLLNKESENIAILRNECVTLKKLSEVFLTIQLQWFQMLSFREKDCFFVAFFKNSQSTFIRKVNSNYALAPWKILFHHFSQYFREKSDLDWRYFVSFLLFYKRWCQQKAWKEEWKAFFFLQNTMRYCRW